MVVLMRGLIVPEVGEFGFLPKRENIRGQFYRQDPENAEKDQFSISKAQGEDRAALRVIRGGQIATVSLGQLAGNRKPQAGAAVLAA